MLRVVSLNLNGIRSAARRGFFHWLEARLPDVVCLQEVKAQDADLDQAMRAPPGYHGYFHFADRKGYSGVAIYSRRPARRVVQGIGVPEFDAEGRFLRCDFNALSVVSVYLPSGSASPERQTAKFRFMAHFAPVLRAMAAEGREIILCGDWNIAHREIDLMNWRGNRKNSGFLPEERAWLGEVFEHMGWVDVYRRLHPEATGEAYTWWSNRGQAWARNVGWRIDYHIATPGIAAAARQAEVYKAQRFSDHAPLAITYRHPWYGRRRVAPQGQIG